MIYGKKYREKMLRYKKEHLLDLLILALKREEKITSLQNRALHLFFTNMADQLNEIGLDCTIEVQGMVFVSPYTGLVFKEQIWRPIQKTLYGIDSTTDLNTKKIDGILDVLAMSFARTNVRVVFPNKFDKMVEEMNRLNKL